MGSVTSTINATRTIIVVILVSIFLWQVYISIDKFAAMRITTTYEENYQEDFVFPSVTFCPILKDSSSNSNNDSSSDTFDEELHQAMQSQIVKEFSHWRQKRISMSDYHKNLSDPMWRDTWRRYIGLMHESPNITACETYTPPRNQRFPGGLESMASFYIDTRGDNDVLVYLHNHPKDVLSPSTLFGSTRFFISKTSPDYTGRAKTYMFKLQTTITNRIARYNYPCHASSNIEVAEPTALGFINCMQRTKEKLLGCRLPWSEDEDKGSSQPKEICRGNQKLREFKNINVGLTNGTPIQIYQHTGCYYGCDYFKFHQELMSQDLAYDDDNNNSSSYSARVDLYLQAAAVRVESEKYDFDVYALVANIGGFMGLLLGWSLLNVFDDGTGKMKMVVESWKEKRSKRLNNYEHYKRLFT